MIKRDSVLDKALKHGLFNSPRQTLADQVRSKQKKNYSYTQGRFTFQVATIEKTERSQ